MVSAADILPLSEGHASEPPLTSVHFPVHTAVVVACKMLTDTFRRLCLDRLKPQQGKENTETVSSTQRVSLFL